MADLDRIRRNVDKMIDQGAPEQDIDTYLRTEGVTKDQLRAPRAEPGLGEQAFRYVDDAVRSVASGMTFGYADELAAYLNDVTGLGGDYTENVKHERERDETVPWWIQVPGEIVGSVATAAAAAPVTTATATGKVLANLPGWVKATGLGGLFGAAFGSGHAEDGLENRLIGAGLGGTAGAVTGASTYGLVRGGTGLYNRFRDARLAVKDPLKASRRQIGRVMLQDNTTPQQARTELRRMGRQGMLVDTGGQRTPGGEIVGGENTLGLGRAVATTPGAGKNQGAVKLAARAEGEGRRIGNAVTRYLSPEDYFGSEQRMLEKLQAGAREAYRQAYEANPSIMTKRLQRILKSPDVQAALRLAKRRVDNLRASGEPHAFLGPIDDELTRAARYARELGKLGPNEVPREGVARGFSLETWDAIKWGLEQVLSSPKYTNELTGRVNKVGYPLQSVVRSLTKELDRATGGDRSLYKLARAQYGGDAEVLTALREGLNFRKLRPQAIRKYLDSLSDAGKEAYRAGAAQAIRETVESVPDQGSAARKLASRAIDRGKLEAIFPTGDKFSNFMNILRSEQRFGRTREAIGHGSRTAPVLAEQGDQAVQQRLGRVGAVLGSQSPFGHELVMSSIGRQIAKNMIKPRSNEEVNRLVAQQLFSRNPAHQLRTLDAIDALIKSGKLGPERQAELLAELLASGSASQERKFARPVVSGLASQVGQLFSEPTGTSGQ